LQRIHAFLKKQEYLKKFREVSITITKTKIAASVNQDNFIINAINNIDETDKVTNALTKRLREWYSLYLPELSEAVSSNEGFVKLVLKKNKQTLLNELNVKESMGKDLPREDLKPIMELAEKIRGLYELKEHYEAYLEQIMESYCKNLLAVCGATIAARLIRGIGGLNRLATASSTTIQMLGAERALFRHLRTKSKPPKYGYIVNHPLVSRAKKQVKGKTARALADKISIAAKVDYFRGRFIGDNLREELEQKFK
jgi:nucleolar protein 56